MGRDFAAIVTKVPWLELRPQSQSIASNLNISIASVRAGQPEFLDRAKSGFLFPRDTDPGVASPHELR